MAGTNLIALRPQALTQTDVERLADRLMSRSVALAKDAPTLAGDLRTSSHVMPGLLAKLDMAAGTTDAARLIAEIRIGA